MNDKVDFTYGGKLKGLLNVINKTTFDVCYTIDGKTGKTTTVSVLINPKTMEMITFDFQDLKKIVEG